MSDSREFRSVQLPLPFEWSDACAPLLCRECGRPTLPAQVIVTWRDQHGHVQQSEYLDAVCPDHEPEKGGESAAEEWERHVGK